MEKDKIKIDRIIIINSDEGKKYLIQKITIKDTKMNEHETQVSKHGETGQGNRLL